MGIFGKKIFRILFDYSTQQVYKEDTKATCIEIEWNVFLTKSFEQHCLLINAFLNKGELAARYSFISLNDADFNSYSLSNAKRLFYETLSPKKHGQVSFDKKGYQDIILVSFTASPPKITTAIHKG